MRDLHLVVIHDYREVIGREAIALDHHHVVLQRILERDRATDQVIDDRLALEWYCQPDDILLA